MIYYKSSLSNHFKLKDKIYKIANVIAKVISGNWLHYTFIVFEFENEGKISFDYTEQGIRITSDERIMEKRRETEIDI
jgi:hypothetical protein